MKENSFFHHVIRAVGLGLIHAEDRVSAGEIVRCHYCLAATRVGVGENLSVCVCATLLASLYLKYVFFTIYLFREIVTFSNVVLTKRALYV